MEDYYLIANIVSANGKNGFLNIESFSDFPERFFNLREIYIDFFGKKKKFLIEKVKYVNDKYAIKFVNFNSDEDAGILIGKDLFIDKEDLIELPENYFFIHDLIGSRVLRNSALFGKVIDVLNLPANDVFVIEDMQGKELLLPGNDNFIESFDTNSKTLVLKQGGDFYEDDED